MAAVILLDVFCRQRWKLRKKKSFVKRRLPTKTSKPTSEVALLEQKCRICLSDGNISIFSSESSDNCIAENIKLLADIEVTKEDNYPKSLCSTCHDLLKAAVQFRQQARDTDTKLRERGVPIAQYESAEVDSLHSSLEQPPDHLDLAGDSQQEATDIAPNWSDEDINYKYEEPKQYKCKKCVMEFKDVEAYIEHLRSEQHKRLRVPCPVCRIAFVGAYLQTHMARVHSSDKPFVCEVCGKGFAVRAPFQRHQRTHSDELPYKCGECPYRGRFSESLKLHMRVHTGEKPYSCHQCPAQFVCASNLNKHMRTHQKNYNYKCEQCERGFYSLNKLKEHLRVDHTGLKEHQCDICGKAFGYRKQMMKHSRKVHQRPKMRQGRLPIYLEIENKQRMQSDDLQH